MTNKPRLRIADGVRSIELKGIQSEAELHIDRHPDGSISLHHLIDNDQTDFDIPEGEEGEALLRWIGLEQQGEKP